MGRRRLIKGMASLGVTGAALANISKTALADSDIDLDNEVPVLRGWKHDNHEAVVEDGAAPIRSPIYTGVSRDEWIDVESTRDAVVQLQAEFVGDGIRVGAANITQGQTEKFGIELQYRVGETPQGNEVSPSISFQELQDRVPATVTGVAGRDTASERRVEGIPVTVRKSHPELHSKYDSKYRPLAGGCQFMTEEWEVGTLGLPVHDDQNNDGETMLTASHIFDNPDGHEVRQPENVTVDYVGSIDATDKQFDSPKQNGKPLFDAAKLTVPTSTDIDWTTVLPNGDYELTSFGGAMATATWYYRNRNNLSVSKQGISTGISSGEIKFVNETSFDVDCSALDGDSGGPYWAPDDTFGRLAGGIHRGIDPDSGYPEGTQIAEIEDRFQVTA